MRLVFGMSFVGLCLTGCLAGSAAMLAQSSNSQPPPVNFTTEQDHQNMMDQLGIKTLRPGPSGNEKAPNHANYDESTANPFPNIPDPLTMNDGQKVDTPKMWSERRRPELVDMLEKFVYGRIPANVPKVSWSVTAVDHEMIGFTPVIAKDLVGEVDNSSYPAISVKIHMTLVTPANAKGPVPVLMMFGRAGFPAPHEPSGDELDRRQQGLASAPRATGSFAQGRVCAASGMAIGKSHTISVSTDERRRRFAQYVATHCSGLGIRPDRSGQRTSR